MKRSGLRHPKTRALARELDIPLPHAIGLLSLLFDFVGEYATAGNVGKFTDTEIAVGCEWPIEDAERLINTLHKIRYFDADETHRFVVHDWLEHCEDFVKKRLARQNQGNGETIMDTGGHGAPANPSQPKPTQRQASAKADGIASKTFSKPSVEEARTEAVAKGMPESEGDKFHDYYETNGWRAGRNPMKNWRTAMANWKRNWTEYGGEAKASAKKSQESYGGGVRPWSEVQRGIEPSDPLSGRGDMTDEERAELLKNDTGLRVRINEYNEWHKKYGQA